MSPDENPLLDDRFVDFLLHRVLDASALTRLDAFEEHSRETFDLYLKSVRRFAREELFETYRPLDELPPRLVDGAIVTHPKLGPVYRRMVELGVISAGRPFEVGGQALPTLVASVAHAYLMAANLSVYGYAGLTSGAAHLIEAFGDDALKRDLMGQLYSGQWTGTMALTEPHAGSSLGDITTQAVPTGDGFYRIRGSKIFISGGDHDIAENIVHMVLARIDGAPEGSRGISLFAVPKLRREGDAWVDNDVSVAGAIHKIGWRGLPSLALNFGEEGDCQGRLVGAPNGGLGYMFQMMNEARIMVGMNAAATASVAYHAARLYALERVQGRALAGGAPDAAPVAIIEHPDVRRMLLRQKAIVEGSFALLATVARLSDVSQHGQDEAAKKRASSLLDLLTPVAKSFPAEKGFEANALALQVHGGYGYSSEYLPEAWLRDQKLNSIHEGTTGIQGLDLLGRKVSQRGGAGVRALGEEVGGAVVDASAAGIDERLSTAVQKALVEVGSLTRELAGRGAKGDAIGMLGHSADYLELFSIVVIAWQWLVLATHARAALEAGEVDEAFADGKERAARYWIRTELPRVEALIALCRESEESYLGMTSASF